MTNQPKTVEECNDMATKALARLTRWAFPDSKIERKNEHIWQLWHTADNNEKYIDVQVELKMKKDKPDSFLISQALQPQVSDLSREDLDDALRIAICSLSE
jgi:hypothetical protein